MKIELKSTIPKNAVFTTFKEPVIKIELFKDAHLLSNILSAEEVFQIKKQFFLTESEQWHPVGVQGLSNADEIGSIRLNRWSPDFAKFLSDKMIKWCSTIIGLPDTLTDWHQSESESYEGEEWIPYSVSPMFRCMKYSKDGQHWPHYDSGFIYSNEKFRTLKSFVLYLSTHQTGCTRIIEDGQKGHIRDRNHTDWTRAANLDEVIVSQNPVSGSIFLFNHRICHDVSEFTETEQRMIIRGDIIYQLKE